MLPSSDKPLRAAWYSRVSTEAQTEAVTIDLQREFSKKFFDFHQEMALVEVYEDDGVSGSIPVADRPGGKRLLADAKAGKFDVIVFYSFDRIVRSTLDLLQFHQTLEKIGIALRSASQPFDTTTHFGKAFMTMLGMIAELERHQIRDRTTRGKLRAVKNGAPPGGTPAFGYRWENKTWVIDEEEAKVVRIIYRMISEGATVMAVMRWLVAHNVPTAREGREGGVFRWGEGMVLKIARAPIYRGTFYYHTTKLTRGEDGKRRRLKLPQSEWISAQVPPIIDEATWHAVQAVIDSHRNHRKRDYGHNYLLHGMVKCDVCGQTYVGSAASGSAIRPHYFYYRHSLANTLSGTAKCPGVRNLRAERLERLVWQEIERFLREPESFIGRLRANLSMGTIPPASTAPDPHILIEQKTAARASVVRMLARSLITEEEAEKELMQLEGELRELEAERDAWAERAFGDQRLEASLLEAGLLLDHLRQSIDDPDADTKRTIIAALVREIRLHRDQAGVTIVDVIYRLDPLEHPTPLIS